VLFVGDDSGDVRAFNARTGQSLWGSPLPPNLGKPVTGAPGGLFQQFGGIRDLVIVGTRDGTGPNELHGRDLLTGALVGTAFTGGGSLGAISGSPTIDYATQQVYFASRSLADVGPTIWCVRVDGSTPFTACPDWVSRNLGHVDGSPVLRNGRVYFGSAAGIVYSLDAGTGLDERTFSTDGDGPVKGFLFPDRRNDDLIFASNTKVWSVSDGPSAMTKNWEWWVDGVNPSVVLYWPGTSYVYVGGTNGRLWQLDLTYLPGHPSFAKSITLGDGVGQIGAPSLDIGVEPRMLIVGSEAGVLYGVEVPF
jgi:outer membrane protein assembly factor BamB